jgi:hypothetical protein
VFSGAGRHPFPVIPPFIRLVVAFLVAVPGFAHAAASAQALTPINQSIAGGETQVFSARFLDTFGRPSVGETVTFLNDACGLFSNGQTQIAVATDATGTASTSFTAFNQGITCWLIAAAGAQVQFNVLTYVAANASLQASLPSRILPGQPFEFTAAAMYGAYHIYNADIYAAIVTGRFGSITPAAANSGQDGSVRFTVTLGLPLADYEIDLRFRDHVRRFAMKATSTPWQDMWWGGQDENGWGVSVVQHGDTLFSVIYAYDSAGVPIWYVMPGGGWNAARTVYSGPLYLPHGTPYSSYDVTRFVPGSPVGDAAVDFTDPANVVLSYAIGGIAGRKAISRQPFGPVDNSGGIVVSDMWWGGAVQDGWGISLLQQYRTVFGVWYTYDGRGAPTWFVMPSGFWSDAETWEGHIYRTTSSPWLGQVYDKSMLKSTDAGTFRFRFSGDTGIFDFTVDGHSGSIPVSRQPF